MDIRTSRYSLKKFDFRRTDPSMTPTYVYPTRFVEFVTKRSNKGPAGRRRKIPPLLATPYLRYELESVPCVGEAILCPPSWSVWQAHLGIISSDGEVLKTLGLLANDPYYGDNCPTVPLNLRSRVESELLMGIKSQKLDLATSVAEGKQTLEWMAARTTSVAQAYNALVQRDYKKFREAITASPPVIPPGSLPRRRRGKGLPPKDVDFPTRSLAANWLEYNYAVVPLLLDIHGAAEHVANLVHLKPVPVYRSRSKGVDVLTPTGKTGTRMDSSAGAHLLWTGQCKVTHSQTVYYQVDSAALRQLAQLGITNPANVLWEKTPFSFLFDWLVPVGDFLSGWDAALGCTFVDGYATTHHKTYLKGTLGFGGSSGRSLDPSPAEVTFRGFVRRPLRTFPYPSLYVKNPFSPRHGATALALLKSIFFKGKSLLQ